MFSVMYIRFKFNFMGCAFSAAKRDMLSWLQRHLFFGFDSSRFGPNFQGVVYLAQIAGQFADRFAWQQGGQRSLLYHFALSGGPRVVFQRFPINISVLFTLVTEGAREFWFSIGRMILTGETEVLGEKPIPVPLRPPQIPYELAWNRIQSPSERGTEPALQSTARRDVTYRQVLSGREGRVGGFNTKLPI